MARAWRICLPLAPILLLGYTGHLYAQDQDIEIPAIPAEPTGALAWFQQGVDLARQGEHRAALVRFERARSLAPRWALPHLEIAVSHLVTDNDRAVIGESLQKAVQLGPELPRAHHLYGIFLQDSGKVKAAIKELIAALKIRPSLLDARFRLALLFLEDGRQTDGIEQLELVVQQSPSHIGARRHLALIYEQSGALEQAEKHLLGICQMIPDSTYNLEQLAKFYERTEMAQKAASVRRRLEKLDPSRNRKLRPLPPSRDASRPQDPMEPES